MSPARNPMRSNLTDIEVMVHHVTPKALPISADGNRDAAVWMPKSQIECEEEPVTGRAQIITLPERLAIDNKGLV